MILKADVTDVIVYIFASYDFETKRIHLTQLLSCEAQCMMKVLTLLFGCNIITLENILAFKNDQISGWQNR